MACARLHGPPSADLETPLVREEGVSWLGRLPLADLTRVGLTAAEGDVMKTRCFFLLVVLAFLGAPGFAEDYLL